MTDESTWFSRRWRDARSQKANLVLLIAGLVLVILAPLWRFAVAPALKIVATDTDRMIFYTGTLTRYLRPEGEALTGTEPQGTDVTIQVRYSNPIGKSTTGVALLQADTELIRTSDKVRLGESRHSYAIDRRTAKQVPGHGSDMDRTGYYLFFPFNTEAGRLDVWDDSSAAAQEAVFARKARMYGVDVYIFTMRYSGKRVPAPEGFPERITGARLKSIIPSQAPAAEDSGVFDVTYRGNLVREYVVEPVSGTQVGVTRTRESVFMAVDDPDRGVSCTQVVYKLDHEEKPESLQEGGDFAAHEIAKITLQFLYIPLLFLLLGFACALVGFFASGDAGDAAAGSEGVAAPGAADGAGDAGLDTPAPGRESATGPDDEVTRAARSPADVEVPAAPGSGEPPGGRGARG